MTRFLGNSKWTWVPLALASLLAGCASGPEKPKPLESLTPKIAGKLVWNQRLDSVKFPLTVAVNAGTFTVAGTDGTVMAIQADSGAQVWRVSVGKVLTAGVGSDGRTAAVVTRDNEVVALEAGRIKWRMPVGTRVTTAPLVAGDRVFVLSVDRSVQAFDAIDGKRLWILQRPGDPLTLSQPGVLAAVRDTLVVGQGPRLAGIDPLRGTVRWEVPVASPRGTNEVERLADLVGPAARSGMMVCARSFQAAIGCVDAERGTLLWSKIGGGIEAVGGDEQYIQSADASDRMTAWRTRTGEVAWTSDALMNRRLTTPLSVGQTVVYGDASGTVHWLARDTGAAQLRMNTDNSGVAGAPVASGTTMLVVTRSGGLYAFRPE